MQSPKVSISFCNFCHLCNIWLIDFCVYFWRIYASYVEISLCLHIFSSFRLSRLVGWAKHRWCKDNALVTFTLIYVLADCITNSLIVFIALEFWFNILQWIQGHKKQFLFPVPARITFGECTKKYFSFYSVWYICHYI